MLTPIFLDSLTESQAWLRVRTVVLDEFHEFLGAHKERAQTYESVLSNLATKNVQKVALSASCLKRLLDTSLRKLHMDRTPDSCIIISEPTFRPELAHHALTIPHSVPNSRSAETVTADLAKELQSRLKPEERIIIFVTSINHAKEIAKALGHSPQYHNRLSEVEGMAEKAVADEGRQKTSQGLDLKAYNFNLWFKGFDSDANDTRVIVATPGLIQGIDHPSIRHILFHLGSYGIVGYWQGGGRGGRGGARCDVFMIGDSRNPSSPFSVGQITPEDLQGSRELKKFVSTSDCRTGFIALNFDGVVSNCKTIGGQFLCDNCSPEDYFQQLALKIVNHVPTQKMTSSPISGKRRADSNASKLINRGSEPSATISTAAMEGDGRSRKRSRLDNDGYDLELMTGRQMNSSNPTSVSTPISRNRMPSTQQQGGVSSLMNPPRFSFKPAASRASREYLFTPSIRKMSTSSPSISSPSMASLSTASPSMFSRSTPVSSRSMSSFSRNYGNIGKAIVEEANAHAAPLLEKKRKSEKLDGIIPILVNCCPVCFLWFDGTLQESKAKIGCTKEEAASYGTEHVPIHSCSLPADFKPPPYSPLPTIYEFWSFKKSIRLPQNYSYCFGCTMPQGKNGFEPRCHEIWNVSEGYASNKFKSGIIRCKYENIVQAFLFALFFHPRVMNEVLTHFGFDAPSNDDGRRKNMKWWTDLLNEEDSEKGEYWKGLEVFLFVSETLLAS